MSQVVQLRHVVEAIQHHRQDEVDKHSRDHQREDDEVWVAEGR
eukprot:CAMPEP_0175318062 /NCGR_PEP_ID=MMETSP0093-20121207/70241_1 /TAXON_ID=311494 /ORGANISM="Alexandrium monilatum, Strain CCMP3105" /LENGTH=42 /DNA_ID= /DNA_START= /DNA_END= /DNA_ORIENTATION=